MTEFEQLFNDNVIKVSGSYQLRTDTQHEFIEKGIDVEKEIEYQISQNLAKELVEKDKLGIFKTKKDNYSVELRTELFVSSREKMFNIFKSFNDLPEEKRNSFIRRLSPDEESYVNQVRQDNLNKIFSPYLNNI